MRDVSGQGLAEDGVGMGAGLNGGGFFELPGCVTTYAIGGTCGRKKEDGRGEGDRGPHFVSGAGKGVSNVMIDNVRLNDVVDDMASWGGFWSAMPPDGSAHRNITFRRVVAMRTERDGVNVHGDVRGWLGEDLHFENQGDDVFAVWGAGGGAEVDQTGLGEMSSGAYGKCGLSNVPATDVVFRRTFAGAGTSEWSSCAHVFGGGRVTYEAMTCCNQETSAHPALIVDSTFCASYAAAGQQARVTVAGLRWYRKGKNTNLCTSAVKVGEGPSALVRKLTPVVVSDKAAAAGWKDGDLDIAGLGCE